MRFSKKRQSILEYLENTSEHPNAEMVYQKLKPIYQDLSLGTVYRNLGQLISEGKICSVGTVLDKERFDAKTKPHTHIICKKCGKIIDAFEINLPAETLKKAAELTDFQIDYSKLQFVGICKECRDRNVR